MITHPRQIVPINIVTSPQTREGVDPVINTLFTGSSVNSVSLLGQGQGGVYRGVITGNETVFKVSWNPKNIRVSETHLTPRKNPSPKKPCPIDGATRVKEGAGWGEDEGRCPSPQLGFWDISFFEIFCWEEGNQQLENCWTTWTSPTSWSKPQTSFGLNLHL